MQKHQRGHHRASDRVPLRRNMSLVGRPLGSRVTTPVRVGTVAVFLAIGVVMFLLVARQVGKRKPVVAGDVVDARLRRPPGRVEEITAAGKAVRQVADLAAVPAPKPPNRISKAAVPLAPSRWESSEAISVGPGVPWLGDELDRGEDRVGVDCFE